MKSLQEKKLTKSYWKDKSVILDACAVIAYFRDEEGADIITITPVEKDDPIFQLGTKPVSCKITDGSEEHDN